MKLPVWDEDELFFECGKYFFCILWDVTLKLKLVRKVGVIYIFYSRDPVKKNIIKIFRKYWTHEKKKIEDEKWHFFGKAGKSVWKTSIFNSDFLEL